MPCGKSCTQIPFTLRNHEVVRYHYYQLPSCFIMSRPRLPNDKIPYWDIDAPDIPNTMRDASATAIITVALI
jgi:hypothetical protein